MLEKVARENRLEGSILKRPARRTILFEESDPFPEITWRIGIQIHGKLRSATDVPREFAIAATEIENPIFAVDKLLKEIGRQDSPDLVPIGEARREAGAVNSAKIFRIVGAHFFR